MEITKEGLIKLADNLMLKLSDQEIDESLLEFYVLSEQLTQLKQIDTEGVLPMIYPFESSTTYLRDDENVHVVAQDEILSNAPNRFHQFIVVPKVVDRDE